MQLTPLTLHPDSGKQPGLHKAHAQLAALLKALEARALPEEVRLFINKEIAALNALAPSGSRLKNEIIRRKTRITQHVAKQLKLVPKDYYRNLWMVLGMSAYGLPLGVVFGLSLKNMGLLAIGLPFGMAIGLAVGTALDKKAAREGRQLSWVE